MKQASYILAIVALLASCGQGDILVDTFEPAPQAPRRIGFDTFVDKATRAAGTNSTALNDYYPTFNVYGWKTVGGEVTCVFNNIPVEYFTDDAAGTVVYTAGKPSDEWAVTTPFTAGWYYENVRYWDQMASNYQFSAYTPATASSDVSCTADGVIKIGADAAPVTVDPKNLKTTPATTLSFTGFDKDYMTAQADAQPSTDAADMSSPVSLIFEHLQAKFNIRIKLDESVKTAQKVSIEKIQIHNLGDKGYYTNDNSGVSGWTLYTEPEQTPANPENTPGTVDEPAAETPDTEELTEYVPAITGSYQLNGATAGTDNFNGYYVLEQLIIPQTITKYTASTTKTTTDVEEGGEGENTENGDNTEEPENGNTDTPTEEPTPAVVTLPVSLSEYEVACVYVEYTIGEEIFKSYTPLANIFTTADTYNFEGGNQYTLNITVGPKPIKFTAEVTPWVNGNESNLPMD